MDDTQGSGLQSRAPYADPVTLLPRSFSLGLLFMATQVRGNFAESCRIPRINERALQRRTAQSAHEDGFRFYRGLFGDESLKKASLRVSRLIEFGASPRRRHP